jgi:hypothetical protein
VAEWLAYESRLSEINSIACSAFRFAISKLSYATYKKELAELKLFEPSIVLVIRSVSEIRQQSDKVLSELECAVVLRGVSAQLIL